MLIDRKKLEIAMARACMNTNDLKEASALPRATVNNAISGRNVRPATAGKMAAALNIDVTEILEN